MACEPIVQHGRLVLVTFILSPGNAWMRRRLLGTVPTVVQICPAFVPETSLSNRCHRLDEDIQVCGATDTEGESHCYILASCEIRNRFVAI